MRSVVKELGPWHSNNTLCRVINRIPITSKGSIALQYIMMQFHTGFVPDNHENIEQACRMKADNIARNTELRNDQTKPWFKKAIHALHRSRKQAAAKEAAKAPARTAEGAPEAAASTPSYVAPEAQPVPLRRPGGDTGMERPSDSEPAPEPARV